MNALEGQAYYTIHVTPEPEFSYASFETNVRLRDYDSLVEGVLSVFRPRKFTMTLFAEKTGMEQIEQNPFDLATIDLDTPTLSSSSASSPGGPANTGQRHAYLRSHSTLTNIAGDYFTQMGNWVSSPPPSPLRGHVGGGCE
ncbi:unnamed protein product [Discosporangium mesarthrocarpum]